MSQENVEVVPQESIVLATFKDRFAAERMLASLGRTFRREARAGKASSVPPRNPRTGIARGIG